MKHNPQGVTWIQLQDGLGWRFLDQCEVVARDIPDHAVGIQSYNSVSGMWSSGYAGNSPNLTYRTKMSVSELLDHDLRFRKHNDSEVAHRLERYVFMN